MHQDPPEQIPFPHAREPDEIFRLLESRHDGLNDEQVTGRLGVFGANLLPQPAKRGAIALFFSQFNNVLIYLLLFAAVVTGLLGHWIDSGVIAAVVLINAAVGYLQEGKAERALDAIRGMLAPRCTVVRQGRRQTIPAEALVPGDVVLLQSGDKVPADLRLFSVKELRIDEAILTGESVPVQKSTEAVNAEAPLGDRRGVAYSGTLVAYGQGSGVVVGTGAATELGRINAMLAGVQTLTTPLLRQMTIFGRWLSLAIVVIAAVTFLFVLLVQEAPVPEIFMATIGLAVAAIPEGLPAILTITLAIGVQRMARRNAIVRRLPAVETLGSVTTICSDKTGTLTRNEMTVTRIALADELFEVSGVGYAPEGSITRHGEVTSAELHPDLRELARAGLLCNEAELEEAGGQWRITGDPTEGALVVLAAKAGLDRAREAELFPRTDIIPFESQNGFMATLHHDHAGHAFIYVKGAPERVFRMCSHQRHGGDQTALNINYWHRRVEELAAEGQRVLAVAAAPVAPEHRSLSFTDVEAGFVLLGLVGIIDPPREEAIRAIDACQKAGVTVKMITGDHAATARAIGHQLGIGTGAQALTGQEVETLSDEALRERVNSVDVFARSSPEHKLRLVRALQANGDIVAMTGDGVNDAPALKRADVGIAMGEKGTEVSKEAAEIVLADDNFASIARAVEEGRTIHDNLTKAILFILPTNGGQAGTIIIAMLFGLTLPITPVQILWVNMVTAVTLALTFAFEPAEGDVMHRPPRRPGEPLLSAFLIWRIGFVSLILIAGTVGMFIWETHRAVPLEAARVAAVNTLVVGQIFYLFSARHMTASSLTLAGLAGNPSTYIATAIIVVLQLLFTYFPPMEYFFGTAPIGLEAWVRIIAIGALVFLAVESEKLVLRRNRAMRRQ